MKNRAECRHKSSWRVIKIVFNGRIYSFGLDEHGRMKKKLPRQHARDLSLEINKISSKNHISSPTKLNTTYTNLDNNEEQASSSLISPDLSTSISSSYAQDPHLINSHIQPSFTNSSTTANLICNQAFPSNMMTESNSSLKSPINELEETKEIDKPEENGEGPHDQKITFNDIFNFYNNTSSDDVDEYSSIDQILFEDIISHI